MDRDPHNQQLQQLAHSDHPQQQSHPQQPHPHQHRQHPSQSQLLPQLQLQLLQQQQQLQQQQPHPHHHHHHQQQQQQQLDSTPQDVLAEARKNLQFLIDSGLSKDFLHQWVDNDLSLQLSFPCQQQQQQKQQQQQPQQQSLAQSFAPAVSPTSSIAPTPLQSPLLTHPTSQPRSHLPSPSHAHMSMLSSPLQQPIPLSPTQLTPAMILMHTPSGPSGPGTMTTTAPPMTTTITRTTMTTPPLADSHSTMASSTPETPSGKETTPTIVIKPDPSFEDGPANWAIPLPQTQTPVPVPAAQIGSLGSAHDSALNGTADAETSILIPPPMPPLYHRPRISVSSTSSGSSGHASIWSANSAHSAMSWHSASSSRSMAPLPMPPPVTSTSAAPLITNAQSVAANKQNMYWCTSCETSFKRKYDWKRHEDEFHERWRKYPCPEPGCNRSFWGSNSFNQHHKQCHGCKTCPHAEKVVKFLRKRKYWACGFCSALHPARERHVEHVARHFEAGLAKGDWMHSRVIYGLLHQPLIHGAWDALVSGKHGDHGDLGARRPQFSWHPNKTGRAQGFLEKENPGQLQDLLEFFSGDEGEAQWIVTMAYDLADVVLTTPTSTVSPHPPLPLPPSHPPASCPSSATALQSQQHLTANAIMPASGPFSQQQDHQHHHHQHNLSFPSAPPVPSQTSQQGMMASPISATPSPFTPSPYRSHIFVPSPGFPSVQQPSPDSMTQSPLLPSQAPSHLEKRELPPIPHQPHGPVTGSGMMDFEYSAAPVLYEEWESLTTAAMVDASQLQHQHQQQSQQQSHQNQPSNQGPPADWGMSQYFNDS